MRKNLKAILGGVSLIAATLLVAWWLCPQERPERVQNKPTPNPTPTAPFISHQEPSLVELERYTETLLTQIPSALDLKEEDFDSHSAPRLVLQFAPKLAHVHDVMRADSRNVGVGLRFFERCALDHRAMVSVRAVCFRLFRRWDNRTELPVGDEIANISKDLPGDDL